MKRIPFWRPFLIMISVYMMVLSGFLIRDTAGSDPALLPETRSEGGRGSGGDINLPVWRKGMYWSYRREAHCIDDEGYEYDQKDNRTYTVTSTDELYSGHGAPVECYNLSITGDIWNYREAELDTSEYGFDYGTVPYKTTFTGDISGHMLVEKSTLALVQIYMEKDGTAYIYDLSPVLQALFGGNHHYSDLSFRNYTPPLDLFRFPADSGDSYHITGRIDHYSENYLDIEGGQVRKNSGYYLLEDDVTVSTEKLTLDQADAYHSGEPREVLKFVHTNNGGELHSGEEDSPEPPQGGTRTQYVSVADGWYARFTYDDHFGPISTGYVMDSVEYLKDTNYRSRDPTVDDTTVLNNNATNSGNETVVLRTNVSDPDGRADIATVEADMTELNVGMTELYDDGTHGDEVAGDHEYAYAVDISDSVDPGSHRVEITVYDLNGNTGSGSADIRIIAENEAPNIYSAYHSPSEIYNDGETEIVFTADADDPDGLPDIAEVKADLSPLGGDPEADMADDGAGPDDIPEDGKYALSHIVPASVDPGGYTMEFTVKDAGGKRGNLSLAVTVEEYVPVIPPEILSCGSDPETAELIPGLSLLFTVEVHDENGLDTIRYVEGDLSSMGGNDRETFYDDGTNGDIEDDDGVFSLAFSISSDILEGGGEGEGTNEKIFSIPVTVSDETNLKAVDTINVTLKEYNQPPYFDLFTTDMEEVFNDGMDEVTLTTVIIDNDTMEDIGRVWVDTKALVGRELNLTFDGSLYSNHGDFECVFIVPSSAAEGTFVIRAYAEDSAGHRATVELAIKVKTLPDKGGDDSEDDDTGRDTGGDTGEDTGEENGEGNASDPAGSPDSPGFSLPVVLLAVFFLVWLVRYGKGPDG